MIREVGKREIKKMTTDLMLRVPSDMLSKAKDELAIRGYTPLQLATEINLAVQLVENFLNGEIVDRNTYNLICDKLSISTKEIDDTALNENPKDYTSTAKTNQSLSDSVSVSTEIELDKSLNKIRNNISLALIRQCDRLRIIDVNAPINLHDLYTEINIFTVLPSSQNIDLDEAFVNVSPEQYDRFYLAKIRPSTIPANQALEESPQILLVGSLGSGKTTLLKYWSMACISGKILPEYLPVFLPLRSLVSLIDIGNPLIWLKRQITNYGLSDESLDSKVLEQLLNQGRLLLLWDGLDELPEVYRAEIAQKISDFCDRYPKNRAVLATRNPIYGHILESFSTLAIAPFEESQISIFANKWFQTTCSQNLKKVEKFQQLLATNQPLAEIASNPLLLTHLCTVFNNCDYLKSNFYQEILNLLLTKWEQTKCLPSSSSQTLSTAQKLDLLSYVAIVSVLLRSRG